MAQPVFGGMGVVVALKISVSPEDTVAAVGSTAISQGGPDAVTVTGALPVISPLAISVTVTKSVPSAFPAVYSPFPSRVLPIDEVKSQKYSPVTFVPSQMVEALN